jgi:hypothetical protein
VTAASIAARVNALPPVIAHDPDRATLVFDVSSGPANHDRRVERDRAPRSNRPRHPVTPADQAATAIRTRRIERAACRADHVDASQAVLPGGRDAQRAGVQRGRHAGDARR